MAITLPPQLDATLELAGIWFPNINEDEIHADADAARIVQAHAARAGGEADTTVRGATAIHRGDSAVALQSAWNAADNSTGHLAQAAAATRVAPAALDGLGYVVTGTKIAIGSIAAIGTVRMLYSALAGGPLGGFTATATLLAIRRAGTKVLREAAEGTGRQLAPALTRRATAPLRDILARLRPPGAPGAPALAGAGGRLPGARVPLSGKGLDGNPGILQMGRRNRGGGGGGRRGGDGGRRGGGGNNYDPNAPATFDERAGRMHGKLPSRSDIDKLTPEEAAELAKDYEKSVNTRDLNQKLYGNEAGHDARLDQEKRILGWLRNKK